MPFHLLGCHQHPQATIHVAYHSMALITGHVAKAEEWFDSGSWTVAGARGCVSEWSLLPEPCVERSVSCAKTTVSRFIWSHD